MRLSNIVAGLLAMSKPLPPVRSPHDPGRKERELYRVARSNQHPRPNTSRPHTVSHNGTAFVYPRKHT